MNSLPNPAISLRPAKHEDALQAAELICLSMGEMAGHIFEGQTISIRETIRILFTRQSNRFGEANTTIAQVDGEIAGLLISYPGRRIFGLYLGTGRHLLSLFGLVGMLRVARRALPMSGVREAKADEYYISNLAVLPRYQRRGIGARLLVHVEGQARRAGLTKCSLIVDAGNQPALHLYQRMDFRIVFTGRVTYPGYRIPKSDYHRMVKHLS